MDKEELKIHFANLREDLRHTIRTEVEAQVGPIKQAIGEMNDSGDGGTGLSGQLARTMSRVDQLFTLKNIGVGVILTLSVTGTVLFLGIKGWIVSLLKAS